MASEKSDLIEVLVADSAAFLKNVPLQNMAKNIYTISEVVGEIKSAAVRQRLAVLPYEIVFRVPSCDSLHVVSEFAKKTGDFQSLSLVDLKVLALTYQLHKEKCGTDDLRSEPTKQVEVVDKNVQGNVPGFYVKSKNKEENADEENDDEKLASSSEEVSLVEDIRDCSLNKKEAERCSSDCVKENVLRNEQNEVETKCLNGTQNCDKESAVGREVAEEKSEAVEETAKNNDEMNERLSDGGCDQVVDCHRHDGKVVCYQGDDNNDDDVDYHGNREDDDSYDEAEDDDDGWITPGNIHQVKADYGISETQSRPTNIAVGCLTTDFAMQNVLIKMGLHVISVEGMLIKEARSYILKCYSCFKVTTQMQRIFCPKCGNRTLVKVSVSVNEEGVTRYHMPKRNRPFNIRGKKHPLPLPKGGRHNNNPLLFEDQLISQRRLPKAKDKINVLDEDYVARSSPFSVNDTTSRAFNLGFHVRGQNKRNPNEAKKKTRRKK